MKTTCPECGHSFEAAEEASKPSFDHETPFDSDAPDIDEDALLVEAVEGNGKVRELET